MHNKNASPHQPRLPFEIQEVWTALPEEVRKGCENLCRQLLATVLEKSERRQDERED
jgi:hypothetical protein